MQNEWINKLTEAQKEKLRGLIGSSDDMIAFCKEEKLDLPDDLLEGVAGGLLDISNGIEQGGEFCPSLMNQNWLENKN